MNGRFTDVEHVFRLGVVFALAVVAFLAWRAWMIPDDFGVYGHYRASALTEARARPVVHAGQAACLDCHDETATVRASGGHARVSCESCHGALASHAEGRAEEPPGRPDGRSHCLPCHAAGTGKPPAFPQVIVSDHAGEAACVDCHQPHTPGMQ
jgi:hypothetical protein